MASAIIAFELEVAGVAEVDRFFEVQELRVSDLRGAWPATDAVFSDILARHFDSEGAHGGTPWPDLAVSTQYDRRTQGYPPDHPILVRSGMLRDSFVDPEAPGSISEHGPFRWARGSTVEGAAAHQTGTKDGRLPKRAIIEMNDADRHRLLRPIRNWVTGHDPWAGASLGAAFGRDIEMAAD